MTEGTPIFGDLCLGEYPIGLSALSRTVASMPHYGAAPIDLDCGWFDLTMLGYLAVILRSCRNPELSMALRFANDSKYSFLWRSGLFAASRIGHQGSPFKVAPDIWRNQPRDTESRANFTPLIALETDAPHANQKTVHGYSELARDATFSLLSELEKTLVYEFVEHSDLMESREYLHIVLWELVQNVMDHARSTQAVIAAQLFYKGDCRGKKALSGLRAQHLMEEEHCVLPLRKQWLIDNRDKDYLMLTCVDNGMGIPASIRNKKEYGTKIHEDTELLGAAFRRELSDHDRFEERYAIHGLHLIAQLISSYEGYLFAQSGKARIEVTGLSSIPAPIEEEQALPGTAFQVLLPLSAGEARRYFSVRSPRHSTHSKVEVVYATEELRKHSFLLPPAGSDQKAAVEQLVSVASASAGPLFLDFVGMPRERHFTSLVLLCVRRKKTDYPVIILNASEEVFTAVRGLRSAGGDTEREPYLDATNRTLATDLTRGEAFTPLPLILAITRLRETGRDLVTGKATSPGVAVQWLGISDDGPQGLGACTVTILDVLFGSEGCVEEAYLEQVATRKGWPEGTATTLLRNLQRVNPNLLSHDTKAQEWSLAFTSSSLYVDSVWSLEERFREAVDASARYKVDVGTLFFLNWRTETEAYLSNYYQLWPTVRNPELARIAAALLLQRAYDHPTIGPSLSEVVALVSVTASAGQVAREIARILRIPHWEAPSVYDLAKAEWPPNFGGKQVLIVDDLIDTGTASRMLIEEVVVRRKAECAGVLSVLASKEGLQTRDKLRPPIISLIEVALGRPTPEEIAEAEKHNTVFDIDPHTLEPIPRNRSKERGSHPSTTTKNDLEQLARYGGLQSGHFVYGGHHYYEFFDIVRFIKEAEGFDELWKWFRQSVIEWHSRRVAPVGGKDAPVSIVYPYYSAIAAFLHRIRPLLQESLSFPCTIHVACPFQRSKQRLGYRLDSLSRDDRFAVFVDDGVASGGTLSEIVDAFVALHSPSAPEPEQKAKRGGKVIDVPTKAAILALPVFDRIGMNPRKHLKSIQWYRGGVSFDYEPKYSLNLRAYYAKDCPLCLIEADIDSTFRTYEHVRPQLETHLGPVRELIAQTFLSPVATFACRHEMNMLSQAETVAVVYASHVLFSDSTSGTEIKRSIEDQGKSPMSRLEILLNVMMDPIIYRSVHDRGFFLSAVPGLLWGSGVSKDYRTYFLLHMPYIHPELASSMLLKALPDSLGGTVFADRDGTPSKETPTRYFDNHPEVFACIIAALWTLRRNCPFREGWDIEWRKALRGTPYGNQFTCGTSATREDVAKEYAVMLLCNFVTSYSGHRESYLRRLEDLRNLIDVDKRANAFPRHSMTYLVNAIETVRDYYDLDDRLLSHEITDELVVLHADWLNGNDAVGGRLRALLVQHFVPEQTIHQATIKRQLLDGLAPKSEDVVTQAKAQFEKWLYEQFRLETTSPAFNSKSEVSEPTRVVAALIDETKFSNEATGVHLFGNTHFIVRALAHLLRNAFESGMGRGMSLSTARPNTSLSVTESACDGRKVVRFEVSSAQSLTQEEIDHCFRAGGGLMAQRQVIMRWGGELSGHPISGGRTVFFLELEAVEMTKKGSV